jgi:hypothetical protein
MTVPLIVVVLGLLGVVFLLQLAKGRGLALNSRDQLAQNLRPVDIAAFRNLVDPAEEDFLRANLRPPQFRAIHRERLRAAIDYIYGASHNAAILLRMGEAARLSSDSAVAEAGERLVESALRLRLYAFRAIVKLYIAILVPSTRISPADITDNYERMTRMVVLLGCLRFPTQGIAAAL